MTRRTWALETALALLSLAAIWPIGELTQPGELLRPGLLLWALVAGGGALTRGLRRSATLTVVVQLALILVGTGLVIMMHGHGINPGALRALAQSAADDTHASVAPLPASLGIIVMLTLGIGLVTLVIDYVGGTARTPLLTALPAAAPFVLTTTALGATLPAHYFVAAALAWALLVLVSVHTGYGRTRPTWRTLPTFVVMVMVAVIGALLVAPALPHRDTPALSQNAAQGVDISVNFSENLDLSRSLNSQNSSPVLLYTTDDPNPGPLRVTTSSTYTGDGQWKASALKGPFDIAHTNELLPTYGFEQSVATESHTMAVNLNGMRAPLVATGAPLSTANFGDGNTTFQLVRGTGVPRLAKTPEAYRVMFREFTAASRPRSNATVTAGENVTADDLATGQLPAAARTRLDALRKAAGASGQSSHFTAAVALQRYLRTSPNYTYSLKLAGTRTVDGKKLDPLANFLETRQGYCTQFATAMVMAARQQGIPARMAIGFLPGTPDGASYSVHAADAHAWAELYFPGMGWTRFDPTPGARSGAAPPYAPDQNSATASSTPSTSSSTPSTATPTSTRPSPPSSTSTASETTEQTTKGHEDSRVLRTVLSIVGGIVLVALLLSMLPLLARWRRRRLLAGADDERAREEARWRIMGWDLEDLGLAVPPGLSPRRTAATFAENHPQAGSELLDALTRAAVVLEGARYAPATGRSMASSTARVTRAARETAGPWHRLRALLFPRSGLGAVGDVIGKR